MFKFNELKDTFQNSIFTWDYFTDFEKVKLNVQKVKIELNILNSLIGEDNIEEKFIELICQYPNISKATGFWVNKSKEYNFLLIMHEHLFIFKKR